MAKLFMNKISWTFSSIFQQFSPCYLVVYASPLLMSRILQTVILIADFHLDVRQKLVDISVLDMILQLYK